jgi:hypothetical protein
MVYEHVSFNEAFWKRKTEVEFLKHEAHHGLTEEQLKEAFALMNEKPAEEKKAAKK